MKPRAESRSLHHFLPIAALLACAPVGRREPSRPPASAAELIQRMHDRYQGTWFKTLTFTQRTTLRQADGREEVSTWLEALLGPSRLRIDIGPLADRNGVLYTADSVYRVQGGRVVHAAAEGNPLMPFVAALYLQPVERTLQELARQHYDTTQLRLDRWEGAPVMVVGARSRDDLGSPQFWVDLDRLVLVRMLLPLPRQAGKTFDIRLSRYQSFGGSLVATHLDILANNLPVQTEDYSDVRVNVPLSPALFDASRWSGVRHWSER